MSNPLFKKLSSRKFLLALFGVLGIMVSAWVGEIAWNTALDAVWKIVVGYMGIEGTVDALAHFRNKGGTG